MVISLETFKLKHENHLTVGKTRVYLALRKREQKKNPAICFALPRYVHWSFKKLFLIFLLELFILCECLPACSSVHCKVC